MTTYRAQGNAGFSPVRKDRSLQRLNADFGLCSSGQYSDSTGPLIAKVRRDDATRANDGTVIAMAETS